MSAALALAASSTAAAAPGDGERPDRATASRGAVDEVAERVGELWREPGFGKVVVDYAAASVQVYWKGEPPAAVAGMFTRSNDGVRVRVAPVRYSEHDFTDAGARVLDTERARLGNVKLAAPIAATVPAADMSTLVVEVVRGTEPAGDWAAAAGRYQRLAKMPVRVRVVEDPVVPASRRNDSPPWQGGAAIADASGDDYCSTGFAVLRGLQGRLLSAGHCGTLDVGDVVRDGVGDRIGVVSAKHQADIDSLLINPDASPGTIGEVYGGPWNAGPDHPRFDLHVGGAGVPQEGQTICSSGARSGEHCGLVIRRIGGVSWSCDGQTCNGFRASRGPDDVAVAGGDSGGPLYDMRDDGRVGARGIISAGSNPTACGSTAEPTTCYSNVYGIGIHRLLNHWNATIEID